MFVYGITLILVKVCVFNNTAHKAKKTLYYKYKKQLQKIEKKVGMEYQKAYKQG